MRSRTILCSILLAGWMIGFVARGQESREVTKTVPLPKNGEVSIDTYKGSIKVETWDKAEVNIVARIEADGWGRYDEEKVRDTEIRIDAGSNSVSIETDYKKMERRRSFWDIFDGEFGTTPFVHYAIKMPATAKLRIKDYKSEIDIADLRSDLVVNTYKGEVDIRSLSGGLGLETYKGECRVDFAALSSESRLETYKGEIRITLPSDAGFALEASVGRRGDFDSDFHFASSRTSRRSKSDSRYSGDINGGGPVLKLRTDKGTFRLIQR